MKILYIAQERAAAVTAGRALHGIAPKTSLTWARTPGTALRWLQGNRDAAAVIVDGPAESSALFVEQVRGLDLTTPVVVVTGSAQLEPALVALNAGADGYVAAGLSLEANLPRIVALATERERSRRELLARSVSALEAARDRAEHELECAEEALQQTEQRTASELAAAGARLADLQTQHAASIAREGRICTALQRRLYDLEGLLNQEADKRASLDRQLAATEAARQETKHQLALAEEARQQAEERSASELAAAETRLSDVRGQHTASLAREARICTALQQRLFELEEQLTREAGTRANVHQQLAAAEAARQEVEQQLARAEEARQQAEQRSASELAAATTRLADVQTRHTASLTREARICTALQERLFELERALRNADERRASEAAAFADQLANRHAEFTSSLAQAALARDALGAKLGVATAALDEERQARRAEAAAAVEQLRRREAELDAAVAEAEESRAVLERRLADAQAAHADAQQHAELDLGAANERQAALEDLLAQEADRRAALDQQLAAAEAARQEADQRHATELTTAVMRLADLQGRHDAALAERTAARVEFGRRLAEASAALEKAGRERASEAGAAADHLARREAELGAQLAAAGTELAALRARYETAVTEHARAIDALKQQLTEAAAVLAQADQRAAAAMTAAAAREAELVERVTKESDARLSLEGDLAAARTESARGRRRSLQVASVYRRRSREQKASLEAQLAVARAGAERDLRVKDGEIQQLQQEHETLRHMLGTTQDQLQQLHGTVDEERQAHERARSASETELRRVSGEYGQLRQSFDALQAAFQILEQVAGEHATERAKLEGVVADRDSQLSAQAERQRVAEQAAQDALAEVQQTLRKTTESSGSEIARLQREIEALRRELSATRSHADALRGVAERVPDLQERLEVSHSERRREFERAPYALCRCTPAGVISDANHAFVTLLGRRRVDELRNKDFAAVVVDAAGDLAWLFERTGAVRNPEPVETTWKTRDGRHLIVRLQALATATGSVEIVVEDITALRALEERLRQAQRMEAVGRLATEVAGTCDTLLDDVTRDANEWLAAMDSDQAVRSQGERLLAEVRRAATFLRRLGVFGTTQARALEPVSVPRVLRDLAPVLKRIVGEETELMLPRSSGSYDVDVEPDRLERVLVNVAGYARDRLPGGARIRIDLATTTVGRRLIARHPNMRPGQHVIITITGLSRTRETSRDAEPGPPSADKPGIELGALADLVAACGGHLWIEAQRAGHMVVKIHLPRLVTVDAGGGRGSDGRPERGGRLARLFRLGSGAGV